MGFFSAINRRQQKHIEETPTHVDEKTIQRININNKKYEKW